MPDFRLDIWHTSVADPAGPVCAIEREPDERVSFLALDREMAMAHVDDLMAERPWEHEALLYHLTDEGAEYIASITGGQA